MLTCTCGRPHLARSHNGALKKVLEVEGVYRAELDFYGAFVDGKSEMFRRPSEIYGPPALKMDVV